MKKVVICFCLFACLLSGCKKEGGYTEKAFLAKMEEQLNKEALNIGGKKSLTIHSYSKVKDEGMHVTSFNIGTYLYEENGSDYLQIDYCKNTKVYSSYKSIMIIKVIYNKSEMSIKYSNEFETTSVPYTRQFNEDDGVITTIGDETTFTQNNAVAQAVLMLRDYLPILENELNIKLSDYGYNVDVENAFKQIQGIVEKNEDQERLEREKEEEAIKQEEAEREAEYEAALEQQEKEEQQSLEEQKAKRRQEEEKRKQEEIKKEKENEKKDYKSSIVVLDYIMNNLDLGNIYAKVYDMYDKIEWYSYEGSNMKNDLSFLVMNVQSMETDDFNRDYYRDVIIKGIKDFKNKYAN